MSINSIGSSSSYQYAVQNWSQRPQNGQNVRNTVQSAVAGALGISVSQLQSDLSGGQSMSQVAQANGMSASTLTSTITAALQSAGGGGSSSTSSTAGTSSDFVSQLANQIATMTGNGPQSSGVGGPSGHHHHHHHHGDGSSTTGNSSDSVDAALLSLAASNSSSSSSTGSATGDAGTSSLLNPLYLEA
jgi:hypothetical protein